MSIIYDALKKTEDNGEDDKHQAQTQPMHQQPQSQLPPEESKESKEPKEKKRLLSIVN